MERPDLLIAGAGPVGCVIAERASSQLGWRSVIVERRGHIAGNCYDYVHPSGVLIHAYGPHYFRTNNRALLDYLSRFTSWIPGNYVVKSSVRGDLFPFPINRRTLEQFFKRSFTEEGARAYLEEKREKIEQPRNAEEYVLSRVGRELYEAFYLGYTLKQWNRHPRELAASVCGRVPIRFNDDERYVNQDYQITPADGFTAMFGRMIDDPRITVLLDSDFHRVRRELAPTRATVYCGPVDEYFDHVSGKLPWRSLDFRLEVRDVEFHQPCVQINYPDAHDYTRSVEIKHVTGQKIPRTLISYEYPHDGGEPFYPVPSADSEALYRKYHAMALDETRKRNVFFCGRLARYRYINTDEAIESALATFEEIRKAATR